ncbi:MAG: phosphodiester glycosidase family protein [Paracoccaceae bacterium]
MTRIKRMIAPLLLALALPAAAKAACHPMSHDGIPYTVCAVDPAAEDLRLFRLDAAGRVLGSFQRLQDMVEDEGRALTFAMNAGMYHQDRSAVGLYVEDGVEQHRTIASDGPGNFGLLPNGVLCLTDGAARVIETQTYLAEAPECRDATQSGPMLVIDGALHPRFLPDSTSRHIRNGVGVGGDGIAYFAISDAPVTFHEFARLFRDVLHTPNALYLDGNISRLYAPDLGRADGGFPMGPIVATVADPQR